LSRKRSYCREISQDPETSKLYPGPFFCTSAHRLKAINESSAPDKDKDEPREIQDTVQQCDGHSLTDYSSDDEYVPPEDINVPINDHLRKQADDQRLVNVDLSPQDKQIDPSKSSPTLGAVSGCNIDGLNQPNLLKRGASVEPGTWNGAHDSSSECKDTGAGKRAKRDD
jgi:hypothetical protein